jgi:hypothetical protein
MEIHPVGATLTHVEREIDGQTDRERERERERDVRMGGRKGGHVEVSRGFQDCTDASKNDS